MEVEGTALALLIVTATTTGILAIRYYSQKSNLQNEKVYLNKELKRQKQEVRKLQTEALRFQFTPHAFRNTLSSLKYFTQMANKTVEHVSEVLDYILYESNTEVVSLERELKFLKEFIDLYKIKIDSLNAVSYNNNIDKNHPLFSAPIVPPLITAYFIENAFKHGNLEQENALNITIEIQNNELIYTVSNKMNEAPVSQKGGIGQANMSKRLELLYSGRYILNYSVQNNTYISILKLKLQ